MVLECQAHGIWFSCVKFQLKIQSLWNLWGNSKFLNIHNVKLRKIVFPKSCENL